MFTGLVEETGTLLTLDRSDTGARLTLRAPLVSSDAGIGDSIAINGCCLTVVAREGDALGSCDRFPPRRRINCSPSR